MRFALLLWISLLTFSCGSNREYRTTATGDQWKLISFTDSKVSLDSAAIFYLDGRILSRDRSDTLSAFINRPFFPEAGPLWTVLSNRFTGDSLEYISATSDFIKKELNLKDTLVYHLRIDRIKTESDLNDARQVELAVLDSIARSELVRNEFRELDGIFMNIKEAGDTTAVLEGREVVIHYRGTDLNGRVFDDSRRMDAPFRFVMGNENQVIEGLEIALYEMTKGDLATLIIPSWYAFGSKGSAGGHVSPYSTVIYTVEVLDVGI
jgi:hypothetical protein